MEGDRTVGKAAVKGKSEKLLLRHAIEDKSGSIRKAELAAVLRTPDQVAVFGAQVFQPCQSFPGQTNTSPGSLDCSRFLPQGRHSLCGAFGSSSMFPAVRRRIDSDVDADFAEMRAALLVTKALDQILQRKGPVDERLHIIDIQCADHFDLLPAVSDRQPLEPHLPGQQRRGRHRPGETGQDADERDMPADAAGADRLRQGFRTAYFDDVINAASAGSVQNLLRPVRILPVVDRMVGAQGAGASQLFIR